MNYRVLTSRASPAQWWWTCPVTHPCVVIVPGRFRADDVLRMGSRLGKVAKDDSKNKAALIGRPPEGEKMLSLIVQGSVSLQSADRRDGTNNTRRVNYRAVSSQATISRMMRKSMVVSRDVAGVRLLLIETRGLRVCLC